MLLAARRGHSHLVDVLVGQFGCSLTDATSVSADTFCITYTGFCLYTYLPYMSFSVARDVGHVLC